MNLLFLALLIHTPVSVGAPPDAPQLVVPFSHPSPDAWDAMLESRMDLIEGGEGVQVRLSDGRLVSMDDFAPPTVPAIPEKEPVLKSVPIVHPNRGDGTLSGKAVYISQCHGWYYYTSLGRYSTQRGVLFQTVEDFHNPEGANAYLIPYLENAGAMVYTARERDINPEMVIVDDTSPNYSEDGTTFEHDGFGFGFASSYPFGVNPFQEGSARRFGASSGDIASWKPDIPSDGRYAIYVSWKSSPVNSQSAHYRISYPGTVVDRYFDQTVHGRTWQYVDTVYLTEGQSLTIELIGDGTDSDRRLSADAIRIGGGTDTEITRYGEAPERPRWESGAVQYTQFNGAPESVYDPFNDDDAVGSDSASRAFWAAWEHPSGEDAVYVSWHSNATASGSARGTVTYFAGGGVDAEPGHGSQCNISAVEGSYTLADYLQEELIDTIHANWDSDWRDRGVKEACFNEVNPSFNNEMPSALIELAFHDNADDAAYLKNPKFRRDASRAMYRAVVRYFSEKDGTPLHYLPEPPVELAALHSRDGQVTLSWSPGPSGAPWGDSPDTYIVEESRDGKVWTNPVEVEETRLSYELLDGATRFFRVSAKNEGGVSFPSETIGARQSPDGYAPVLIVSGFDRLDTFSLPKINPPYIGEVVRMDLAKINPFDTSVPHGRAAADAGWFFDTISDERLQDLDLEVYDLIWWVGGEESTFDDTFTEEQQEILREFHDNGGALWVTGAEILWDLDYTGSVEDRAFAEDIFGASMEADAASTQRAEGVGLLEGVPTLDFSVAAGAPYPVEYPDTLTSSRTPIATYGDGELAGVLGEDVAFFGFPFEAIGNPEARREVAARLLPELVPDYVPPEVEPEPGGDTGSPSIDDTTVNPKRRPLGSFGCSSAPVAPSGALALLALGGLLRRRRS